MSLTIWTNGKFNPAATQLLHDGTRAHRLITAATTRPSVATMRRDDSGFQLCVRRSASVLAGWAGS
jgi:hypothetical protein